MNWDEKSYEKEKEHHHTQGCRCDYCTLNTWSHELYFREWSP